MAVESKNWQTYSFCYADVVLVGAQGQNTVEVGVPFTVVGFTSQNKGQGLATTAILTARRTISALSETDIDHISVKVQSG